MSASNRQSRTQRPSKQHAKKGQRKDPKSPFASAEFQAKVLRLDKLMQLASAPTPKAPPGFTLIRKEGEEGTLQQVGREADNAWAGVKRIMNLLNVESKHVFSSLNANVTQAGAVLDLGSLIAQGVGGSQRTGDSVKIKRVRIKTSFYSTGGNDEITAVLGLSKDGIPATMGDIFNQISSVYSGLNFPNDQQSQADKWIQERQFNLVFGSDKAKVTHVFEHTFNHDLVFTSGTTTTASGSIWFAYISGAASVFPAVNFSTDIEFVDN